MPICSIHATVDKHWLDTEAARVRNEFDSLVQCDVELYWSISLIFVQRIDYSYRKRNTTLIHNIDLILESQIWNSQSTIHFAGRVRLAYIHIFSIYTHCCNCTIYVFTLYIIEKLHHYWIIENHRRQFISLYATHIGHALQVNNIGDHIARNKTRKQS